MIRFRLLVHRITIVLTKISGNGFRVVAAAAVVLVGIYKKSEREEI